jgi:exonuclease III
MEKVTSYSSKEKSTKMTSQSEPLCHRFKSICIHKRDITKAKSHTEHHTLIVGDFSIPLPPMDMSSEQKLNQEIMKLTEVMNQMDLIDIYRTFHLNTKEYTFFSAPCGTFSKIDYVLGHKARLNRYKKIEIIPCIYEIAMD